MRKRGLLILCLVLLSLFTLALCSCGEEQGDVYLYFRDAKSYSLRQVSASFDKTSNMDAKIAAVYDRLKQGGGSSKYLSPFPEGAEIRNATLIDGRLIVSFAQTYYGYTSIEQTLLRASIVKTYT